LKPTVSISAVPRETVPKPKNYYTEPHWIDVEGVPTAYRRKGTGEPLVFFHGAGMTRMWLPFYDELAQSFDVIAPEHPGWGETPMPPWLRGFDDYVLHYHEFFRLLGLPKINLVGFSLGGWTAAEFASFYPDMISTLTLLVPVGLRVAHPLPGLFLQAPDTLPLRLFNDLSKAADIAPNPTPEEITFGYGEATTLARLIWTPNYNLRLERRLNRVAAPALVLRAADDRLVSDEIAIKYRHALPNSRDVVIPGTGHALIQEEPRIVAETITRFVRENTP
jgi:pimeloyl-ACP methyl ester carboxylesterase